MGIPKLVLAELGDLDPGQRGERPAGSDELGPGGFGIASPAEPPQQPGAFTKQAALRPWRVSSHGIRGRPRVGQGIAARSAPEIRPMAGRPPRPVVVRIRAIRHGGPDVADGQRTGRSGQAHAESWVGWRRRSVAL